MTFTLAMLARLVKAIRSGLVPKVSRQPPTSPVSTATRFKVAARCMWTPTECWALAAAGSGGVTSFNTRTGAVVPAANDYSFSLLSGTLADGQLSGSYSSALTFSNGSDLFNGSFTGNGAGLTNVPVSAGSPNYVQNGTMQQTGASFNIDGNGTVGGTLTATSAVNTKRHLPDWWGATRYWLPTVARKIPLLGSMPAAQDSSGRFNTYVGNAAGGVATSGDREFVLWQPSR